MKKILLSLLLIGSMLFTLYLPSLAEEYQDKEQVTFNQAYGIAEYLSKNLKSSQWGSLTYTSGPRVIVGVPSQKMIPQVEAMVEQYWETLRQSGQEVPITAADPVTFVSCKYSQNKLNQLAVELNQEEAVKKAGVEFHVGWDGFLRGNTLDTRGSAQLAAFLENSKYRDVVIFSQGKNSPALGDAR